VPVLPDYPITQFLPEISRLLGERRTLVLCAETGAGKSTLVPPYLLGAGWLGGRKILMLEPRRVAAAAAAARISDLLGERLGETAGFRVRNERKTGPRTRIEVLTEGILTRLVQADPLLDGVGLVVFDEFHERSLHADLALALVLETRRARPDLAVLVMSATIDATRVASFLGGAPVLDCPGRTHPVEVEYRPLPERGWEAPFAEGIRDLLAARPKGRGGDVLAFLPGLAEIRRTEAELLSKPLPGAAEVLALHGSLPLEEQRRVLAPRGGDDRASGCLPPRIVLATSVAETSLTVPGIAAVADSGWARTTRFHPATGMDRLVTERVTLAQADQRKGRAGRLGPGLCVRFWSEREALRPETEPEILRSDLSGLVLECSAWGACGPDGLGWLDPPPGAAWNKARRLLEELGAVATNGTATGLGKSILALGLPPRLGVIVRAGLDAGAPRLAAACAALIEERDEVSFRGEPDFRLRLEALRLGKGSPAWRRAAERETERILGLLGASGGRGPAWEDEAGAAELVVAGYPDRIARKAGDGSYDFVHGRKARLPRGVTGELADSVWIVAPVVDAGESTGAIRMALPLSEEAAMRRLGPLAAEIREVEWRGPSPRIVLVRKAGKLELSRAGVPAGDREGEAAATEAVIESFGSRLSAGGLGVLPWSDRSRRLLARIRAFAAGASGGPPGRLSDADLAASASEWLVPYLDRAALGGSGRPVISEDGLLRAVEGLASGFRRDLDREAPDSIELPTGSRRRIDYSGDEPVLEAKIQEVFGLSDAPRICGRPLVLRLLSPASRPLQITRDLASFWKNTYPEVRKEMRGRYPRHYWPEDPLRAEPTRGPKPRT